MQNDYTGKPLSPSAQKVQDWLQAHGVKTQVREYAQPARTAQQAADLLGCDVGQIVKSLIFRTADNQPVLILTSGANRVDTRRAAAHLGKPLSRAKAEFVRQATGYAIGGVPPVAHNTPAIVLMDADLLRYDVVWAAGGTPHSLFPISPRQLADLTTAQIVDIAEQTGAS